ncbi:MAG: glycosyltransferase family 4 protein [Rubrivivax sp.]|nr:glycosyltransferase family 4 protein [Rubrivivax sp.]
MLSTQLVERGLDVTWLSMRQRQSPDIERLNGVLHRHAGPRIAQPPVRSLWQKVRFMGTVVIHLLRHRYDLVDCQPYAPLPAARLGCWLTRTPIVACIHDTSAPPRGFGVADDQWLSATDRRLATLVEGYLYRLGYDQVLTVAESVRQDLIQRFGLAASRVAVAANGVDVRALAMHARHPQACDIIFVGRHVPHKHPEHFLEAAARVSARRQLQGCRRVRVKLVGAGPLSGAARQRAQELGLQDDILWWGEVERHSDVVGHIRSARLLVLPSTREGFGLVLAEAMACGTGVLAYDIPAVRETLGTALRDALVPPGDVSALAAAIERLLDEPERLAAQVAVGRERVSACFDVREFASRVLEVYDKALATGSVGREFDDA